MKNWLKRTLGIEKLETQLQVIKEQSEVEHQRLLALKEELLNLKMDLKHAQDTLNKHTRVDMDIDMRGQSYIVLSGKWRNNDYVEVITIDKKEFDHVMHYVKDVLKWDGNKRVDAPYMMRGML